VIKHGSIAAVIAYHQARIPPISGPLFVPPPLETADSVQPFTWGVQFPPLADNDFEDFNSLSIPHEDHLAHMRAFTRFHATGSFLMTTEPVARSTHTQELINTYSDTNPLEVFVIYNGDAPSQDAIITATPPPAAPTPVPIANLAHPAMASIDTWPATDQQSAAWLDPYDPDVAEALRVLEERQREVQDMKTGPRR
jgi:hypothetical protein